MFRKIIIFLLPVFVSCSPNYVDNRGQNSEFPEGASSTSPKKSDGSSDGSGKQGGSVTVEGSSDKGQGSQTSSSGSQSTGTPSVGSNGSGGLAGLQEVSFTDSAGTRSSYKINAPEDSTKGQAYGLHIHLHGDGGGGYQDFPNKETRGGLIGVVVKAPNQGLTWGREEGLPHAKYLEELIQNELIKRYNIDLSKIYFSGVSGGSYFLAGHFIPLHGAKYATGAFLMCGGMAPQVKFSDPALLKAFRIHWEITAGERDDIKSSVGESISAYKKVLSSIPDAPSDIESNHEEGPGGHCEFDGKDYTSGIQYMMNSQFLSIVKGS